VTSDRKRAIRVQTARDLEAQGHINKAVALYVAAGVPGEAARVLVAAERYLDAGKVMLDALGVGPDDVGRLEGRMRGAAEKTARCFELGGDSAMAARLRKALGTASDPSPAARPSVAPDVLPVSEPIPSTAPPPSSPSARAPQSAVPPVRIEIAGRPVTAAPTAPTASRPAPPAPTAPTASRPAPTAPPTPSSRPATAAKRPSKPPAAERGASLGTTSPLDLSSEEKWGRAQGWKTGGEAGNETIDLTIKQLLERGRKSAAARVAWDSGRLEEAAQWFAESGLDYETGAVLHQLGRLEGAFEALLRVPADHKKQRLACVKIVDIASRLGRFDFELDRLLSQFAKAPPLEESEIPTYLTLATLYAQNGFHDGARRVLEQILLLDADHEAARAALAVLPPAQEGHPGDSGKRAPAPSMAPPGLRELPPLPTLAEFIAEARKHAPKKQASAL